MLNILDEFEIRSYEAEYKALFPKIKEEEWLNIFSEAKEYLQEKLRTLKRGASKLSEEILEDLKNAYLNLKDDALWFDLEIIKVWKGNDLEKTNKEIKKLKFLLNPPAKEKPNTITAQMIDRAENYPFENLIQFNQRGFTKCFDHPEKTPSLHLQKSKNIIHCFGCGKGWNTISYLRQAQGLDFKEAVLRLQ